MIDYAVEYAKQGLAVLPIAPKGKIPLTQHGSHDATTDLTQIKKWWTKYPDANIGIATGKASGGLVVIDMDVDDDKDKDGYHHFKDWLDENYLYLDDTWQAITGRGGYHLMFRTSRDVRNRTNWIPDVDVRGEGGYIVAPPSIHPNGHPYEWEIAPEDCPILTDKDDENIEYIVSELTKGEEKKQSVVVPGAIVEGGRNDMLYKIACSYQGRGQSDEFILQAVLDVNRTRCNPPLPEAEVRRIVESAKTKPKGTSFTAEKQPITDDLLDVPTLADIEEREQEWLISGYIPKGCVTLLCSDGGIGKTGLWCSILANLTQGKATILDKATVNEFPDWEMPKYDVLYFSREDSTSTVLKRRLRKAGADERKIRLFDLDDKRLDQIFYGSELLEKIIDKYRPAICVFDTLQTFLPAGTKMAERKAMRDALGPLNVLGDKYGTAFLLIMHSNKSNNSGRQRMADSSDIWDLGRSALMAGKTKDKGLFYLSLEKHNYCPEQKTILFSINSEGLPEFRGTTEKHDAQFIMERSRIDIPSPKKEEARAFIIEQLSDGKEHKIQDLIKMAKGIGITESTFNDAKAELKLEHRLKYRSPGFGADKVWYISLLDVNKNTE